MPDTFPLITTTGNGTLEAAQAGALGVRHILKQLQQEGLQARIIRCMTLSDDTQSGGCWFVFCAVEVGAVSHVSRQVEGFIARIYEDVLRRGSLTISVLHETMNPEEHKCPPNVLEALSPTQNLQALAWRRKAADWAAKHYGYELTVTRQPSGRRSISVTVTHERSSAVVASANDLDYGAFRSSFEALSNAHLMSSIRATRC